MLINVTILLNFYKLIIDRRSNGKYDMVIIIDIIKS